MSFSRFLISVFISVSFSTTHGLALSLDSAFTRSDSCVHIQWIADSSNTDPSWYITNGIKCTGIDSVYRHCDFLPGQSYTGIAYSYGGEDPWFLFRSRLMQGYLAGSHLCHYNFYGDPSNRVTGTDCSGFLCFLWNYPRVSTQTFAKSSDFLTISYSQIQPGDALVKSGSHIVFVLEADTITEVVISEASSTVRGCRERLVDLTDPEWESYKAIRYPDLNSEIIRPKVAQGTDHNFSIKKVTNGNHIIHFSKPFSGIMKVIALDGKQILCSSIRNSYSVHLPTLTESVVIVHLKDEIGKSEVRKATLCR
ncbi:MAG TPA: hypothetical protein VHP36_10390 [Chitinispirillaceae bacterium]|nr:hypothetical protein [Chitinispirillaceae bacterium]